MTTDHTAHGALAPELEAIAATAHDRLTAQAGEDPPASTRPPSAALAGSATRCPAWNERRRHQLGLRPQRVWLDSFVTAAWPAI